MTRSLYFIGIVLPEPIATEVREIQNYVSARYRSKASLRSPPHITLVPPFPAMEEDLHSISEAIKERLNKHQLIQIILNGFDRFGRKVIFVNVENNPFLTALARDLAEALRQNGTHVQEDRKEYHPHVTLAFKDLKPEMFRMAWAYFREIEFSRIFDASELSLLRHDDGKWVEVESFRF